MRLRGRTTSMKCCNCGKDAIIDPLKPSQIHPLEGWLDVTMWEFPECPTAELCSYKCAVEYFKFKKIP